MSKCYVPAIKTFQRMNLKMNKVQLWILMIFISNDLAGQTIHAAEFDSLNQTRKWDLTFEDDGTANWQSKWFLDGLRAEVKNTREGMLFSAGPVEGDDACHAVLWTNDSFSGDLKIEYQYTRTDTKTEWVNILYIQAVGVPPYAKDIYQWNSLRKIPSMRSYFMNMAALHISYAAFNKNNSDVNNDYVRARKYPNLPGQNFSRTTEIQPASFNTGLFLPGETYKITVIKTGERLYFRVENNVESKLFSWHLEEGQTVHEGRIGLRHMYTRSALYKDFKIYTRN